VQAQSPRLNYSAIAISDDFLISGNIFKEASEFNINSRSAAAFRGDTEYFTIRFSQFLQMIDQVTPHCPRSTQHCGCNESYACAAAVFCIA